MAAKKYTCTNFANCDAALSKQVIEIEDGEEVVCPSCTETKTLVPEGAGKRKTGGPPKRALIAAAMLVALVVLGWILWPDAPRDPAAMLTEFFPRLQ
jgi:hypothetical protein